MCYLNYLPIRDSLRFEVYKAIAKINITFADLRTKISLKIKKITKFK